MIVSENLVFITPTSMGQVYVEGLSTRPKGPFEAECEVFLFRYTLFPTIISLNFGVK